MGTKLWCVKAYQLEEEKVLKIIDFSKSEDEIPANFIRKLSVVGKDLTWRQAKELCEKYKDFGASIFPNVKEEKLQIIQL